MGNPNPLVNEAEQKQVQSKFQKAREIYYGLRYENSGKFVRGWYNFSTYFRLKSVEIGNFFSDRGHDISRAAKNIKESKFGDNVKKAGKGVAIGGHVTKAVAVRSAKATASLAVYGASKTKDGAKYIANSYPAQLAGKTTKKGLSKAGAWIKGKALSFASLFAKKKEKKEVMIELTDLDSNGKIPKSQEQVKSENQPKQQKIVLENQKKGHFKLLGEAISEKAKNTKNSVKNIVSKGKYETEKNLRKASKVVKPKANKFAQAISDTYNLAKAKFQDYRYDNSKKHALEKNQVKEMLRRNVADEDYAKRLKDFSEAIMADKQVKDNILLRKDVYRLKRNVDSMEKGNIGDIELSDMDSNGHAIEGTSNQGMVRTVDEKDLGKAAIKEVKEEKKKVSIEDVKKEQEDIKLIKDMGLDPKNLPQTVPATNTIAGLGTKVTQKIKATTKSITDKTEAINKFRKAGNEILEKYEDVNDKAEQFTSVIGADGVYNGLTGGINSLDKKIHEIDKKVDSEIKFTGTVIKGVNSVAELGNGDITGKKVATAVADGAVATEAILDKNGMKVPLSGVSKTLYNAMNIADGKEREKNITGLVANGLEEAGKILEFFGEENTFTHLSGLMNDKDVSFVANYEATLKAFGTDDAINQAKVTIKDIQAGSAALKKVLDEYDIAKDNHTVLDQTKFLGPVMTILEGVEKVKSLTVANEKLQGFSKEDAELNIADRNISRMLGINADNMIRQNEDKKTGIALDTGMKATLKTVGMATGTTGVTDTIGAVLSEVSPTQLVMHELQKKTDHELMVEDAFGSKEKYQEYKKKFFLSDKEIQNEILKLSNSADVSQYANRVRAEAAMHIHARSLQAEKLGIDNGATKFKEAAGIEGKTIKQVYKEIGGKDSFDRTVGRTKVEMFEKEKREREKSGPHK